MKLHVAVHVKDYFNLSCHFQSCLKTLTLINQKCNVDIALKLIISLKHSQFSGWRRTPFSHFLPEGNLTPPMFCP